MMRVLSLAVVIVALCGAAAAFEYDPSTEVLMACRPGQGGELACRMVDVEAGEEVAYEFDEPMDFAANAAQASFASKILSGIEMLISGKACGSTTIEGIPVSYCVKRHIKLTKIRYSATVEAMGVQASNREFGGSDTKSGQGAVERAVQNWATKMGQPM